MSETCDNADVVSGPHGHSFVYYCCTFTSIVMRRRQDCREFLFVDYSTDGVQSFTRLKTVTFHLEAKIHSEKWNSNSKKFEEIRNSLFVGS